MKIHILLILLPFVFINLSHSQVQAGLKAGLNLANIYVKGDEGSRASVAYHAGGLLNITLPNSLSSTRIVVFCKRKTNGGNSTE